MARLTALLDLVLALVSCAIGTGSMLLPVRLAIESDGMHKGLEDRSVVSNNAENRSVRLKSVEVQEHPEPTASGSLTCMRWTGGTCKYLSCRLERGPDVVCEKNYCMCRPGSCADAFGKCIPNFKGKWIGEYSIRFGKPIVPARPYLGFDKAGNASGWGGVTEVTGGIAWLAAVSTSEKQWKIAQTPNGRVRLENTRHPGSVLAIYNNRRRQFFMQRQTAQQQKKIKDDDDLWPVLIRLEAATPLEATFQVRPTMKNGGGYELWDPATEVSLASADPDSWGDSVVEQGVTECYHKSAWTSDPCDGGKQLVIFEPKLPNDALNNADHTEIAGISILSPWQGALIIICFITCACCLASDENDPNSRPLIAHAVSNAQVAINRRQEAARQVEAEYERERKDFAAKIAGFWVLESDIGNFEYELWTTSEGISVHGRKQGSTEWDSTFAGQVILALRSTDVDMDTLRWQDDNSTKFSLTFEDATCSGMARAADGKQVSFAGKRTAPRA